MSLREFILDAKSGDDPAVTYRAYHMRLLGDVVFSGCKIRMTKPWFPQLSTYQTLSVTDDELIFNDVDAPLQANGRPVSMSLVRGLREVPSDALTPPTRVGEITVQFVKPEQNIVVGTSFAWLPDQRLYIGSQTDKKLREGLLALTFTCAA